MASRIPSENRRITVGSCPLWDASEIRIEPAASKRASALPAPGLRPAAPDVCCGRHRWPGKRAPAQGQTNPWRRAAEPNQQTGLAYSRRCRDGPKPRLCWTRRDLVHATGLSYRTMQNLEARGLLHRCALGVNVVCYTQASVRALFGAQADDPAPASACLRIVRGSRSELIASPQS